VSDVPSGNNFVAIVAGRYIKNMALSGIQRNDINANGVPDECDPDCNHNGVPDDLDIADGNSLDCNGNGIPDECECAPGPFATCTGKVNTLGCTPAISFQGIAKVGYPFPFLIESTQTLNNMVGLLFYGPGANSVPFQGGTLCVASPVQRTPGQVSGGNQGTGTDCSGKYSYDFNALIASGLDPALVAGAQFNTQYWSRDVNDPFGSALSNALQFVICN